MTDKYGTNPDSVILSDYCYNRINDKIKLEKETRLLEYLGRNQYLYLGVNYPCTGTIFNKPLGGKTEIVIGEWIKGVIVIKDLIKLYSARLFVFYVEKGE